MGNVFNNGTRRATCVAAVSYGATWLSCLALYWGGLAAGGLGGGAIMTYTILVLYVVLPLSGALASLLVGRTRSLGGRRFLAPLASTTLYLIFTAATFGLSTALGLTNIAPAGAPTAVFAFACSFLGLFVGIRTRAKP